MVKPLIFDFPLFPYDPPFPVRADQAIIWVEGTPIPKPRMTQRDKKQVREVVARYRAWCDRIRYAYIAQCGRMWERVALWFYFYGRSSRLDLSNAIKSVEDALNKIAWPDDNITRIPGYDGAWYERLPEEAEQPEGLFLRIRDLEKGDER